MNMHIFMHNLMCVQLKTLCVRQRLHVKASIKNSDDVSPMDISSKYILKPLYFTKYKCRNMLLQAQKHVF